MKIRTCDITVKSLSEDGVFKGYASVFNTEDAHGDVVCKGAFMRTLLHWRLKEVWPKMLWQHAQDQVIGVWTDMREDEKGLYVEGKLLLDVAKAREAYALLRSKAVDSLSIGFRPKRSARGQFGDREVTFLREVDLMEVSLVTFAANEDAKILAVKGGLDTMNAVNADSPMESVLKNIDTEAVHEWGIARFPKRVIEASLSREAQELCAYLRQM